MYFGKVLELMANAIPLMEGHILDRRSHLQPFHTSHEPPKVQNPPKIQRSSLSFGKNPHAFLWVCCHVKPLIAEWNDGHLKRLEFLEAK